jgi:hypothetical protein
VAVTGAERKLASGTIEKEILVRYAGATDGIGKRRIDDIAFGVRSGSMNQSGS